MLSPDATTQRTVFPSLKRRGMCPHWNSLSIHSHVLTPWATIFSPLRGWINSLMQLKAIY